MKVKIKMTPIKLNIALILMFASGLFVGLLLQWWIGELT